MLQTTHSEARSGSSEAPSAEQFLRETLIKLRELLPKRNKELRDELTASLERLDAAASGGICGDDFFGVLRLACSCQYTPKVVASALNAIELMVKYGFLTGKGPDPYKQAEPGAPPRTLIDSVVDCVCNCEEKTDETVELARISALLMIVTSPYCEVHGNSLILAIQNCFQIQRDTKSTMNQRTAQAYLNQMLTKMVQRVENSATNMSRRGMSFDDAASDRQREREVISRELALMDPSKLLEDWTVSYLTRIVDKVVIENRERKGEKGVDIGGVDGSVTLQPPGKFGWCVVCRKPAPHYCVETQDPVCGKPCKFRNLDLIHLVEANYGARQDVVEEKTETVTEPTEDLPIADTAVAHPIVAENPQEHGNSNTLDLATREPSAVGDEELNIYHRDALQVFASLCHLTMKENLVGPMDQKVFRCKRTALELVLMILQSCGPVLRSSERFIQVLKNHLCVSLIKNSVSSVPRIFGLSLQIFWTMMETFKEHLRTEIGVFIEQVFLRILESGNSTYVHKLKVLQVFSKLCTNASTALEIFLNFDCDVDEKNIFAHMIDCLSKIAQGKYNSSEHSTLIQPHQEQELKELALKALVTLMSSIVDWARGMQANQFGEGQEIHGEEKDVDSDDEETGGDKPLDVLRDETDSVSTQSTSSTLPENRQRKNSLCQVSRAAHFVVKLQENKQRKHDFQAAVNKFNMKPKRGVEYLKENGFISDDPRDIASLFLNTELGFSKTAIGDYLGEDKEFNKAVLHALVDEMDFKNTELDQSLRNFLSVFRLPGEAQKIDRMMEKFAEKYCQGNPGKFANPDCAFVLSFAMIMLQTDLHNPGIKNKMTKDGFVKNNRGINDNADLPREYLEKLYDSVASNPISLKEDEEAKTKLESQAAQSNSQKFELFRRETDAIIIRSQELMKQKGKASTYVAAENVEHVRLLFDVACWPMLATLAVLLEMQEQTNIVLLCIEGFKHCIRIAARFDMETERDAFVSSLAKFTYLTTIKEMKQKNIECIKALLAIGLSEGNNLGSSWSHVLHCISQLERLQLIGEKKREDFQYFHGGDEASNGAASSAGGVGGGGGPGLVPRSSSVAGNQVLKRRAHGLGVSALVSLGSENQHVEMVNSEFVSQIDAAQIDLVFNRSVNLGKDAIVHFVTQITRVSKEELALLDQPRIFSLQKLVEVADFNMNKRPRYIWSKIWRPLSQHFIEVASHPNIKICMFAIDSLRQLAMKFLEKDELSKFNFQADFLRPFAVVMQTTTVNYEVKELIASIISNMVQARINNIKSGWKVVFQILSATTQLNGGEGQTGRTPAMELSWQIMEKVLTQHREIFIENVSEGVPTLLAFAQCQADQQTSINVIEQLVAVADYLATCKTPPGSSGVERGTASHIAEHWLPILISLSKLINDPRPDVKQLSLKAVFDCLDKGAEVFDQETLRMVFNGVVKPLFDDIHHQLQLSGGTPTTGSAAHWAGSKVGPPTCLTAMNFLVELFSQHLQSMSFLLDDVLTLIVDCVRHDSEQVARIGVEVLKQLLVHSGRELQTDSWQKITDTVLKLFDESMPVKLLIVNHADGQLPFRQQDVIIQCVVHLLLIDAVQEFVSKHYANIPPRGLMTLLEALKRSIDFAQDFNQRIELRQTLKKLGFMREMKQLPGLLKQEREALSCSLKMLFQIQQDPRMQEGEYASQASTRLKILCCSVLQNYVAKDNLIQDMSGGAEASKADAVAVETEREVMGLVSIISEVILKELADLQDDQFALLADDIFPLLCDLTAVSAREVRIMVRKVLKARVAPFVAKGVIATGVVAKPSMAP